MTALEKAAELQEEAMNVLLAEREQIDARLEQLGHNNTALPKNKRGRPKLLANTGADSISNSISTNGTQM